ncbi:hypothetical protein NMG60_11028403 [Bertholletia excelsa]
MGKSPGKWIKTVLFGKKSSKSNLSKNAPNEKKVSFDAKAPSTVLAVDPPIVTHLPPQTGERSGESTQLERGTSANLSHDEVVQLENQGSVVQAADLANKEDIIRQNQAATKAQAAFRGYLARRAFWALKGIIRLQALIRGHLVRRQAVATLYCMQAIIKFQATARGRRVRLSEAGFKVFEKCKFMQESKQSDLVAGNAVLRWEKLSRNAFVTKLVSSSSTVMALRLQYDVVEPNSIWNWLERWSSSHFWEPPARPKKSLTSKHQKKHANLHTAERESGRPKRNVQRFSALNGDSNSLHSSVEIEKPRRNQRKSLGHQTEPVQDQPQSELERVKRSLRKVSVSAEDSSDKSEAVTEKTQKSEAVTEKTLKSEAVTEKTQKSEAVTEKMQRGLKKVSGSPAPDVREDGADNSSEKIPNETVAVSEQPVVEVPPKPLTMAEPAEVVLDGNPAIEEPPLACGEKVVDSEKTNEELSPEEDQTKENQKTRRRRSFPGKQEYPESVSQNTPTLPSYMAATESAKAKLRAQGSPRLAQDGAENGFIRRHSLPSSANGKLSSPRIQRPVIQANGKGSRSDRSLLSSRDGNERMIQPGWRR